MLTHEFQYANGSSDVGKFFQARVTRFCRHTKYTYHDLLAHVVEAVIARHTSWVYDLQADVAFDTFGYLLIFR
jgi:hypothetical protein